MEEAIDSNDIIFIVDKIIGKELTVHNIKSFDQFITKGIHAIIVNQFKIESEEQVNERDKTEEDKSIGKYWFKVKFNDVIVESPKITSHITGRSQPLFPNMARNSNLTYSANIYVDATITAHAITKDGIELPPRKKEITRCLIAQIPIMVRCEKCNTNGYGSEMLKQVEEDPNDDGGYFIIGGIEWAIDSMESVTFNMLHAHRNVGFQKEIARGEFISKPGDYYENSARLIIRYKVDGAITVSLDVKYIEKIEFPFYIIFRLMGMSTDMKIIETVVYDVEDDSAITKHLQQRLESAFGLNDPQFAEIKNVRDRETIIEYIAQLARPVSKKNDNITRISNRYISQIFNIRFLPHIGLTSAARSDKLHFLGYLIRKVLLMEYKVIPSTDRDSYVNKRIHAPGETMAKAFKLLFNISGIEACKSRMLSEFKSQSFSKVNLETSFKNAIKGPNLERKIVQQIRSGQELIKLGHRQEVKNRIPSQILERKNQLNAISAMRTIGTPNKKQAQQNARAIDMRRNHPTIIGINDFVASADTGNAVGMVKHRAVATKITTSTSSALLRRRLEEDDQIIKKDKIQMKQYLYLAKIFVNGLMIGCCEKSHEILHKYRMMRRRGEIDRYCTIRYDPLLDEIYFWVDYGRILRPLLVVSNNIEKIKSGKDFEQYINITKSHINDLINGKIDIDTLEKEGLLEYISAEEQQNCLIAYSLDNLKENRNNIKYTFTHCELEQAILGLTTLTAPFANHSNPGKLIYQGNQSKQTCGWFATNYPFRADRHSFLQNYCEKPLIPTLVNNFIYPNGSNVIVAMACYSGYNQEDSMIFDKSAIDRGLYGGSHYYLDRTEIDSGEIVATPDFATTMDIKQNACYEKLVDGLPKVGTLIEDGDIVIGKISQVQKPNSEYKYIDRSVRYSSSEPAVVEKIIEARNDDGKHIKKVKLRSYRSLESGDKLCLTNLASVLTRRGWKRIGAITLRDEVLTLNGAGEIKFQLPTRIYEFNQSDVMYNVRTDDINLLTTMGHRMYVRPYKETEYKLIPARDLLSKKCYYKKSGKNGNFGVDTVITVEGLYVDGTIYASMLGEFLIDILEQKRTFKNIVTQHSISRKQELGSNFTPGKNLQITTMIRNSREFDEIIEKILQKRQKRSSSDLYGAATIQHVHSLKLERQSDVDDQSCKQRYSVIQQYTPANPQTADRSPRVLSEQAADSTDMPKLQFYTLNKLNRTSSLSAIGENKAMQEIEMSNELTRSDTDVLFPNLVRKCVRLEEKIIIQQDARCSEENGYRYIIEFLVEFITSLSETQARSLLRGEMGGKHVQMYENSISFIVEKNSTYDILSLLALHAGYSVSLKDTENGKKRVIINTDQEVEVNTSKCDDKYVMFKGTVYCLEVPNHVFYVEQGGLTTWTGNSSRSGNKGVVSLKYQHSDMPYSLSGITPDLIINPHCIPTRMIIGQIIESVVAKVAALKGTIIDGTAFRKIDLDAICDELEGYGFERYGTEKLFCGMSGEWMDHEILMCPTYYQRIQKFSVDTAYVAASGPTNPLTRQPVKGKGRGGGLRIGEMETWALGAHGAARCIAEKLFGDSDGFNIYVCRNCGRRAIVNKKKNMYKCKLCDQNADIMEVPSTWSSKLLFDELTAMGIDTKFTLEPFKYPVRE